MAITDRDRRRMTALAVTVLAHAAIVGILLCLFLKYDSTQAPPEWPPVDSSEILFGGEMVAIGEFDQPDINTAAPTEATSAEPVATAQEAVTTPPVMHTSKPSPAKGADQNAQTAEEAARQATAQSISNRVFGSGSGKTGSPDGNTATGGSTSGVAASGMGNRKAISLPKPSQGPLGQIVVKIKVNHEGYVKEAQYFNGSGAAAASTATRNSCVEAARKARFSPSDAGTSLQTGTLTYTFK